ncbi:MAG: NAD-dependent deacylase [Pseudomonadota bacterium]
MTENIVILTGAGISAASGIATFRGAGGLWRDYDVTSLATPQAFARNPDLVHEFYNERRAKLAKVEPNAAHFALAALEQKHGAVTLITQNVDDLHARGGSQNLIQMHGKLKSALCTHCDTRTDWQGPLDQNTVCPNCGQTGGMRPDIVWFGEVPHALDQIEAAMRAATLFVSIGTSGAVYPAAGLLDHAHSVGAHTIELNLETSERSHEFHESRIGAAIDLVPQFVQEVLQ